MDEKRHITYADAGVDVDEGARAVDAIKDAVRATRRPEVIGGLGGFGSCFSMKAFKEMDDPVLVSGTDGVGTKLALAQLLHRHETVGQDLVAMCVDDVVPLGAEPLFFLDYIAIGKLRAEHVAQIVQGIADGCTCAGCALVGGEMAEHPGVMKDDDYDLAGFVVGVVDRSKMIGPEKVKVGDIVLGLPFQASIPTVIRWCVRLPLKGRHSMSSTVRLMSLAVSRLPMRSCVPRPSTRENS